MAIKNKLWHSEQILHQIYAVRSRDERIDYREVILAMDRVCNVMAKEGMFENWALGSTNGVDDQFNTTWENLQATDPSNGLPSYVALPCNYVSLPDNQGIVRVYFMNDYNAKKKKYFDPVIIGTERDQQNYNNSMVKDLESRLSVYPKNGNLYFNKGNINDVYGKLGLTLMIRSSADIADDAHYPIPGDKEHDFHTRVVDWFLSRLDKPVDRLKDNVQNN